MARAGERTPPDDVEALHDDPSHDGETSVPRLFKGRPLESYTSLATNPYLSLHAELGRPAMTSEAAAACKGRWDEEFGREAPLHVEIGAGNGFFLSGMAARHPEFNWLGVEIRFKRVVLTARKLLKVKAEGWSRITRYDGNALPDLLRPGEVAGIYLNHPDPWPKRQQAHNRMICGDWLDMIATLLRPGGDLKVKTDHQLNVLALVKAMEGRPFTLVGRSDDVANDGAPWPDDVVTNYQRKFNERGLPVYALWLRRD
jgi:tRNA (guanine-N7-)-methyltransferase